ncbi:MAG: DegT/DnrJ/EryC1/StrS family aminotransferase [Bdellovibrionota bacterium]
MATAAKIKSDEKLAIHGGTPVRSTKMPARFAFGPDEEAMLMECIRFYRERGEDPGYQSFYEDKYCDEFARYQGGGYADGVSCGTAGVFVGLRALDLPPGSEVIISPVTDSGPLGAIILQGFVPVVADAAVNSFNMGVEQFLARITPRTSALVAIHAGGEPLEIDRIVEEAHKRGIKVLEDCSQATGGSWKGKKVGTFGDIAAFSTMYRKNLAAGGSSGILYTTDHDLYQKAQGHADRGKPVWKRHELDLRNPGYAAFPALNFNTDEFRCAVGLASLRRLDECNEKRKAFLRRLLPRMKEECSSLTPFNFHEGFSPFYFPILVDESQLTCTKLDFARAVAAEGIGLGDHYGCLVSTWPWAQEYLSDDFVTVNAISARDRSFNLYVNECYGEQEVEDCIAAFSKVERHYSR